MIDAHKLRADFPILSSSQNKKTPVYFDNACMSLRPQVVVDTLVRYYSQYSACAGRSNHHLAQSVSQAVMESRQKVQSFLNAKSPSEIIFTRNTTEGINLIAHSLGFKSGDVILTSDKEHNSNLVPWLKLVKTMELKHQIIPSHPDNTFNLDLFAQALKRAPVKLVSIVHTSNLDGVTFPIREIVQLAHKSGALVLIDAAQSAPHQLLDVQALNVDFLAFSAHKLCGPSGMGILYGKRHLLDNLDGFMVGGDTVEYTTYDKYQLLPVPEKFEAGLQDYAGIMGVGSAVDYLKHIGMENIHRHVTQLNQLITRGLESEGRLHLIGPKDPALRGGIFSFYVDGLDPHQISLMLDQTYGILVRSGQHCVHSWFHARNLTGSVRASLYFYNTQEEAQYFVDSLKSILSIM